MNRKSLVGMVVLAVISFGAQAQSSHALRADESLMPKAGFFTPDGRIGHPLQPIPSAAVSSHCDLLCRLTIVVNPPRPHPGT